MIKSDRYQKRSEYNFLKQLLEEKKSYLEGDSCDDIDCDKYVYKDCLKKKYKPVLEHSFSCFPNLKHEIEVLTRLLSLPRYNKFRYKICPVCKKKIDELSNDCEIIGFTKPVNKDTEHRFGKAFRFESAKTHKRCAKKFKIPDGWKKFL